MSEKNYEFEKGMKNLTCEKIFEFQKKQKKG